MIFFDHKEFNETLTEYGAELVVAYVSFNCIERLTFHSLRDLPWMKSVTMR